MDSMRSLNTSLPTSRSSRSLAPELLQTFKSAALSVTNLYKTAVTDQANIRHQGYQDALDDLLSFLDKDNLGLQDGEGWKIRQWATERFEGADTAGNSIDSDEDRAELEKRARSSSPISQARPNHQGTSIASASNSNSDNTVPRTESAPPTARKEDNHPAIIDRPAIFTFSTPQTLPNRDIPMQILDNSANDQHASTSPSAEATADGISSQTSVPLRVGVLNRGSKMHQRHSSTRHNTRSVNRDMGFSSGTKRKFNLPEFFDISNIGISKDGSSGGGKRGRYA